MQCSAVELLPALPFRARYICCCLCAIIAASLRRRRNVKDCMEASGCFHSFLENIRTLAKVSRSFKALYMNLLAL